MSKDEQIQVRITESTKEQFQDKTNENGHFMTGVILMFIDAYIKNPEETMQIIQKIRKS